MKNTFTIHQSELVNMLTSMQPICSKRTTLDVTETILFHITPRELILKSTDLEISLQSSAPIESSIDETIEFLVSGKRIFDLVKELDGPITCILDENSIAIKALGIDLSLNIKDAQDFPLFPERIENLMHINAPFLLTLLNKVAFLIPQNNANPALNGMLFEFDKEQGMSLVTTDGHCLAQVQTPAYKLSENKQWLLPKRAVIELKKILEVTGEQTIFLGMCGNQLVFSGSHFNFFTRLIAEPFPHYHTVMNKEDFLSAQLTKNDLLKTLKRTGCLLAGQFISTHFQFQPGRVDVSVHNKEVGKLEESLSLHHFEGSPIMSKFYSPYLLGGLQVFPDENVRFFIKNNAKPIIFQSEQNDYQLTYLVMPVSASQGM